MGGSVLSAQEQCAAASHSRDGAAALSLEAGEGWSGFLAAPAAGETLAIEVERAGWLAVQAETEGTSAWLELVEEPCGQESARGRSGFLEGGLIEVESPGRVLLRVGSVESPGSSELTISTHLFERGLSARLHKDGEPGSDTEEFEDELIPLLFPGDECFQPVYPRQRLASHKDGEPGSDTEEFEDELIPLMHPGGKGVVLSYRAPSSIFTKDGEPGSDTEEFEDELIPLMHPGNDCSSAEALRAFAGFKSPERPHKDGEPGSDTEEFEDELIPLIYEGESAALLACRAGEPFDDFRFCAAEVSRDGLASGRLSGARAVDRDYVAFVVEGTQRVTIRARGGVRTTLLDVNGRRLGGDEAEGGERRSSTLDAVLTEGRYYLRIEGPGAATYEVELARGERG
ncbi:MAG: hypothetical protein AAF725_12155 [Acidobacteriota bacterium]